MAIVEYSSKHDILVCMAAEALANHDTSVCAATEEASSKYEILVCVATD